MARRICQSGDGVEVVPGVAGSGKTHTLAAARQAWEESGRTVIGAAQMARTARRLQEGSGIPSMTLATLEKEMTRYNGIKIGRHHVIVVDEGAVVGTRAMNRLISRAHRADAKLVLIGDAGQLPEIAAGGAFAGIAQRIDPAALTTNRRQHHGWERQALADLREGNGRQAIGSYVAHDRVHVDQTESTTITQDMVDQWWRAVEAEREVLMLAARRHTVADLNRRARARMIEEGQLASAPVELGSHEFAIGDRVLGLRNDYGVGILNGTVGTITGMDPERRQLEIESADDGKLRVPFRYAGDGHLTHGYAMTIHKGQGATVDQALVLVDETMSREAIYTAMSRGRHRNDMYLAIDDGRAEIAHAPELVRDPIEALIAGVDRSAAQEMAIERGRTLER